MSLDTMTMCQELARRVPCFMDIDFSMARLNQAFRWVSQKSESGWIWERRFATVLATTGATFPLPGDCDIGKPIVLSGPTAIMAVEIPYRPYDENLYNQQITSAPVAPGMYSCWSYVGSVSGTPPVYAFTGYLYPTNAAPLAGTHTLPFAYHAKPAAPLPYGSGYYYPLPDEFDDILILHAEGEAMRILKMPGWESPRQEADQQLKPLIGLYRSSKRQLAGIVDQQVQAQEAEIGRNE